MQEGLLGPAGFAALPLAQPAVDESKSWSFASLFPHSGAMTLLFKGSLQCGIPHGHQLQPWLLSCRSSSLLVYPRQQKRAAHMPVPLHPHARTPRSAWPLALVWPNPCCYIICGGASQQRQLSSLHLSNKSSKKKVIKGTLLIYWTPFSWGLSNFNVYLIFNRLNVVYRYNLKITTTFPCCLSPKPTPSLPSSPLLFCLNFRCSDDSKCFYFIHSFGKELGI